MVKNNGFTRHIFGIHIFVAGKERLLAEVTAHLKAPFKRTAFLFTPNPEQVSLSFHSKVFFSYLNQSTWNLPDGAGIVWALQRKHPSLQLKRIAGREVFHELLVASKEKNWNVFLLGGKKGSAQDIALTYGCAFDEGARDIKHETPDERTRVLEKIRKAKTDLLCVAYGGFWQEKWLIENKAELSSLGVKVGMVVGGAFEYESGRTPKVPSFVEKLNLEWLWRLVLEPWRWKRQLKGLEFFYRVLFTT